MVCRGLLHNSLSRQQNSVTNILFRRYKQLGDEPYPGTTTSSQTHPPTNTLAGAGTIAHTHWHIDCEEVDGVGGEE
ncbi:hypothetical protein M7I_1626 [Glarea lozoyensis 74030]|uniref:Uncharacterized protein n=1 Tax=Glarea lozoyensis (strain ATCC 74030 / MF5533) TaxID=1104152 RepID=H0EGK9_GLAL7|nr:hypothetical protein M7I_1626 [Glarea lozoyensis 74030]